MISPDRANTVKSIALMSKYNLVSVVGVICWLLFTDTVSDLTGHAHQIDVPHTLDLYISTPEDNRLSVDRIELGQKLFFEKLLSRDRTLSCGSCHDSEHSFTVAEAFAKGIDGQRTTRNPPAQW